MSKLWVLVRVNFRALLATFSVSRSKKHAAGGIGALALLGFLAVYLSTIYSSLMIDLLESVGLLDFVLPLMAIFACVAALMFTVFAASGIVFGTKDSDFMLSLPVTAFQIMLAKLIALYLENLVFCVLWMLPCGITYGLAAQSLSIMFFLQLLLISVFLPFLPSLLGMLLGYIVALFSAHAKRKALVSNVVSFLLMGLLLFGSLQINQLANILLANAAQFTALLDTWLLPFGLLLQALLGNSLALVGFCIICTVPFLVFTYLFSLRYKKILSGLSSHVMRNDYKLHHLQTQKPLAALLKKEAGRYFGTSIYFFNTAFGMVALLVAAIASIFFYSNIQLVLAQLDGLNVWPILLAGVALMISMTNTTCVSLSLEGKTIWILKEAPLACQTLFLAKAGLNVLVIVVPLLISFFIALFTLQIPLFTAVMMLLVWLALSIFVALFGLCVNLVFPKMDGVNDTLIVKQSASCFVAIFAGMLFIGLGALLYWLFGGILGIIGYCAVAFVLLCAFSALCWYWLCRKGAKLLLTL